MISITLGPEPPILAAQGAAWGQEFADALAQGLEPPHRYRRDDVKDALREETEGKCAYCESRIEHVAFAHIEHILPKSLHPLLVCIWSNLTLACPVCNTNKGDYCSAVAPLLNPYIDRPERVLVFAGPMAVDQSPAAKLTIAKLQLNRAELLFRRSETLRDILRILDLMVNTRDNQTLFTAMGIELQEKLSRLAEYTNCARCFVNDVAPQRGLDVELSD